MAAGFTKGLHDLGPGLYAYLQPDGGWGLSNAGLIVDGTASLLVDTLFDGRLTKEMLDRMRDATGLKASDIRQLVNTHANGDHTFGNYLVTQAEIIASQASAEAMAQDVTPKMLAGFMSNAGGAGEFGDYMLEIFGRFHWADDELRLPTRTFSGRMTVAVGDKPVELIEVGPAHTEGDVLVHSPKDRAIFTGDILFIGGTPIMWQGPVRNWVAACDLIAGLDVDFIVPGHGPLTDKAGVRRVRDYLTYVDGETRRQFDAGMSARDAAYDISLGDYAGWTDAERIVVNVDRLYQEYSGIKSDKTAMALFADMAGYRRQRLRP